jgi:hypothetical protein
MAAFERAFSRATGQDVVENAEEVEDVHEPACFCNLWGSVLGCGLYSLSKADAH